MLGARAGHQRRAAVSADGWAVHRHRPARQIIAFSALCLQRGLGTLLGALAALLGSMLSFGYARLFGKGLLRARLGERAGRFDRFIHDHPFSMTVLVRCCRWATTC